MKVFAGVVVRCRCNALAWAALCETRGELSDGMIVEGTQLVVVDS